MSDIEESPNTYFLRRPSGIMQLDVDLAGGLPAGGLSYISGPDNCLSGATMVCQSVRTSAGVQVTHKNITLERLYERFHRLPHSKPGKGNFAKVPDNYVFYLSSMNDDCGILQNKVIDVVQTGENECFEIITKKGHRIEATALHRFFTGETYTYLKDLKKGSSVYVHTNTRRRNEGKRPKHVERKQFYVEYHPVARIKQVKDRKTHKTYAYHVLFRSRAVVEAAMNNMSLDVYIEHLNNKHKLKHLMPNQIVHHIDGNVLNDDTSNLSVMTPAEHMREHLKDKDRDNYFRFKATPDTIISIKSVGVRMTYDIKMEAPYHNFVANNFVVHNCGKSFLLYKIIAMNQKLYGEQSCVGLAVSEAAPDHFFMRACGVWVRVPEEMIEERQQARKDVGAPPFTKEELAFLRHKTVGTLKILRGETGEQTLQTLLECFESKLFDILGCDSVSALLPDADQGKDLDEGAKRAAAALMLTRFFQVYLNGTTGYKGLNPTTTIFTAQVRSNSKKAEAPAHIAKYLPDYVAAGSYAARHGKLIDLLLKPGSKEKEAVDSPPSLDGSEPKHKKRQTVSKTIHYEITKGKAGIHDGIVGEYDFNYDILHDDARSIIVCGMQRGIVKEQNDGITFLNPITAEPYEGLVGIPVPTLCNMIRSDFSLELKLRRAVLTANGIECAYR